MKGGRESGSSGYAPLTLAVVAHPTLPLARCHVERKASIAGTALVELGRERGTEPGRTDMPTHQVQLVAAQATPMAGHGAWSVRRLTLLRPKVGHGGVSGAILRLVNPARM